MADVTFKPNRAGIIASLKQPGVCAELSRRAGNIAAELNMQAPGYESHVSYHRVTAVGQVHTATIEAMENEARTHSMEPYCDRSIGGN